MTAALDSKSYVRSLDGIRAISIALVLLGHLSGTRFFPNVAPKSVFGDYANLGVQIFFVISGYLITTLLLREVESTGRIQVSAFYVRRALRIFPPFFVYLFFVSLSAELGWITLGTMDLFHAVTFTTNYSPAPSWWVGHLWSLSVEEQFYLLWPFAVQHAGIRNSAWIATGALLLAPLFRLAAHLSGIPDLPIFPAVLDGMAIGCILAILQPKLHSSARYLQTFAGPLMGFILAAVLIVNKLRDYTVVSVLGTPLMLLGVALLIDWSIRSRSWIAERLNDPAIRYMGKMSYSLYLWQQLFINRSSESSVFPINIACAFLVALVSYRFIEQPTLLLRKRFSTFPGPGTQRVVSVVE